MSSSIPFLPPVGAVKFSPWEAFDRVWTSAVGYPAEEFKFIPGETPMATLREAVSMVVLYYAVIFGGQAWMKNRPAYKLNGLFMAHNFMLTVLSGTLLVLFAQQLIPSIWKHGLFDNICGASGWTKPLVTLYYVCFLNPGLPEDCMLIDKNSWTTSPNMWSCLILSSCSSRRNLWVRHYS